MSLFHDLCNFQFQPTALKINILDMIESYLKSNETNMKNSICAIQRMPNK